MFPFGRTATIIRDAPGGYDQYGDPVAGGTTETDISDCGWAPRVRGSASASGPIEARGRDGVIVGLTLYAPYGSDIRQTDRVRLDDGTVYQIEGDPGSWWNPLTGSEPGMEIALKRTEG